eukprot:Phypoly_transcript_15557.p1 GENE.Phypoly_transcript_15557~~Phypoly_transcript_15557.p1  ORF type:complete len:303 (+),score=29.74 Phypoly_transcript_15557:84-911(+)
MAQKYPELLVTVTATIYANTSLYIGTEFFDANTSDVLNSVYALSTNFVSYTRSNNNITSSQATKLSPCDIMAWNTANRNISARNIIFFESNANRNSTVMQSFDISGTYYTIPSGGNFVSSSVQKFFTFETPAASAPNTLYQVTFTLTPRANTYGLPFSSYCLNRNGSCSNTNCVAQGEIDLESESLNFTANLSPSGLYVLSLTTETDNVPFSMASTIKEIKEESTTGGHHNKDVDFHLPVWAIVLIVLAIVALLVIAVGAVVMMRRKRNDYDPVR